jgi:hypothetical protein
MTISHGFRKTVFAVATLLAAATAEAGFPSTETFLPAVGRVSGQGGAQFYTTVWATNLTGAPVSFTFDFLKQGQANTSPASFADTLSPGQTKVYENVVESKLGLSNVLGAARITSSGEILLSERIYNQAPGDDIGKTEGLFFAGVPKAFSILLGQSASIQGVNQGGSENFRYNFALVETGGGSATINAQLFDGSGTLRAAPAQRGGHRCRHRDDQRPDHGDSDGRDGLRAHCRSSTRQRVAGFVRIRDELFARRRLHRDRSLCL